MEDFKRWLVNAIVETKSDIHECEEELNWMYLDRKRYNDKVSERIKNFNEEMDIEGLSEDEKTINYLSFCDSIPPYDDDNIVMYEKRLFNLNNRLKAYMLAASEIKRGDEKLLTSIGL